MKRVLSSAAILAAALAGTFATAAPAQASVAGCVGYLDKMGYKTTIWHEDACAIGSKGDRDRCTSELVSLSIRATHALNACNLA